MYLKSIKAHGFKSFADKVELEVNQGITIIVGPNGSGKSNVVDAIRWVLGEQSIKELRGSVAMSDVIFSGSATRSPLSRATVSLTFDNSDHFLHCEYDEVEIKRVCYRTGESEYYLNNVQVRLKDITDLFMDSGAGRESFNLISQGKVKDIIDAKPEDRRTIIEEAAGLLKYKKRKEETQRKLDKTSDNLERINLIINEIETTINPLKEQAIVAKEYVQLKSDLEGIEIALIANDIHNINDKYEELKKIIAVDKEQIETMEFSSKNNDSGIEKLKLTLIELEEKISNKNKELLQITEKLSSLDAEKQMTKERQKYEIDDQKLQDNVVILKEKELDIKKNIEVLKIDIEDINNKLKIMEEKLNNYNEDLKKNSYLKHDMETKINNIRKSLLEQNNKKEIIESNIQNDDKIPYAVRNVINNPKIKGIHNILGKLIDIPSEYATAIDVALGYSSNVIIVDDENVAKEAINYLKQNNLGKCTFFPLNIITARGIDQETINKIKNTSDFVGIASDLVKFDNIYRGVICNQLGNTIIVKDIDAMNRVGKLINYRYRVISLDGELLHTGGSVTGGSNKSTSSIISQKFELESILRNINNITTDIKILNNKYQEITNEFNIIQNNIYEITKEKIVVSELLNQKNLLLNNYDNDLTNVQNELKGTVGVINNTLIDDLNEVLEKHSKLQTDKEIIEHELTKLKNDKFDLTNDINEKEMFIKKSNSEFNSLQNRLKDNEIAMNKYEVKLDSLLQSLNEEWTITYEKAYAEYKLDIDDDLARSKVQSIKSKIRSLGDVNTGSIAEYDRLDKRYSFLTKQRDDLNGGINDLNEIIYSLDETMKEKFDITFDRVNEEFNRVFKLIFKGGSGYLKLTNPEDMLKTGVEIIAEPPGKKLQLLSLLSGGEMSLTAIALLFAVLNTRPTPFCVLDEAEAALDDANVDTFGKYIKNYANNTQFIIITHKKKTMEYADTLYGITMQESGVSKIVSVKLDEVS